MSNQNGLRVHFKVIQPYRRQGLMGEAGKSLSALWPCPRSGLYMCALIRLLYTSPLAVSGLFGRRQGGGKLTPIPERARWIAHTPRSYPYPSVPDGSLIPLAHTHTRACQMDRSYPSLIPIPLGYERAREPSINIYRLLEFVRCVEM